jgi:hypothetical protein
MKHIHAIFLLTSIIATVTNFQSFKKHTDHPAHPPFIITDFICQVDQGGKGGITFTFTSTLPFAKWYDWELGDGITSKDSILEHTYADVPKNLLI